MSNVGFRVYTRINRPDPALIEEFLDLAVADISDCMSRSACVDSEIRLMSANKLLGTAFTVKVPDGNNLMFHVALSLAEPGDVIVVDGGGFKERAISGQNMMEIARLKGIRGFVVDGAVRDSEAAKASNFPIFARSISPNAAFKGNGPGEINVPVSVGGIVIFPGDIIVGDADGVVAVRPRDAAQVAMEAKVLAKKQADNLELILRECSDRSWVMKALEEGNCLIINKAWDETE